MRSNRFVDLRNARKSVTESVTKIDRNDLISVSLYMADLLCSVFLSQYPCNGKSWVEAFFAVSGIASDKNKVIGQLSRRKACVTLENAVKAAYSAEACRKSGLPD